MKLGLISYNYFHLKTEQLVNIYIRDKKITSIKIFALPFKPRKERKIAFLHRPDMTTGIQTKSLASHPKVEFRIWDGKESIGDLCDLFVIAGAGILDIGFAGGKPIVNAHPGIIPLTRGLDSFKWAIYNGDPIGITLHLIDKEVDKGKILVIKETPVLLTDTIHILASRHYNFEIDMLSKILDFISLKIVSPYKEKPATMRMNYEIEAEMLKKFDNWKKIILKIDK